MRIFLASCAFIVSHLLTAVAAISLCVLLPVAPAFGKSGRMTAFPEIDRDKARPVVVVARVSPGELLPEFEECRRGNVICLHSPLWFRARVTQAIYGTAPGKDLEVATTSHYGMSGFERDTAPHLMLLLVEGDTVVMPRYAEAALSRREDDTPFLLLHGGRPPHWLPCSILAVKEEIAPTRFPGLRGIREDEYSWEDVSENAGEYTIVRGKAFPRFGIRLSALQAHLAQLKPDAKQFTCEPEEDEGPARQERTPTKET